MTSDLDIHRSAKLLIDPPGDYGVALVWKSSPAVANVCNGSEDGENAKIAVHGLRGPSLRRPLRLRWWGKKNADASVRVGTGHIHP